MRTQDAFKFGLTPPTQLCLTSEHIAYLFAVLIFLSGNLCFGIYIFATGFFPVKDTLPGYATNLPNVEAKFDRLIFVLIDALRSDLAFSESSEMHYVKSLIRSGDALAFQAFAHPPTVTLPRIKALMSGTIPSFVDFIGNFHGTSYHVDNLLVQFQRAGKKVIFYGDDTWLKLFPNSFHRFEGVTSFFVTDTVEVDNNVTRNLWPELAKFDWDVMILHYLGLDHIGHLRGPHSSLMKQKQKEMDTIIERIHKIIMQQDSTEFKDYFPHQMQRKRTLLVVCGDHGMNELGNHGGSTEGETTPALIFLTSKKDYFHSTSLPTHLKRVAQIDIVPTLALLFGLPIPKNNLGTLIPELFDTKQRDYLIAIKYNTEQLIAILREMPKMWNNGAPKSEHVRLLLDRMYRIHRKNISFDSDDIENYLQLCRALGNEFATALSNYKMDQLILGIIILAITSVTLLLFTVNICCRSQIYDLIGIFPSFWRLAGTWLGFFFGTFATLFLIIELSEILYNINSDVTIVMQFLSAVSLATTNILFIGFLSPLIQSLICRVSSKDNVFAKSHSKLLNDVHESQKTFQCDHILRIVNEGFILIALLLHLVSSGASSLIEEEHQIIYFFTTTSYALLTLINVIIQNGFRKKWKVFCCLSLMLMFRLSRSWNQTGNKWIASPDIGKYLNRPQNSSLLSLLTLLTFAITIFFTHRILHNLRSISSFMTTIARFLAFATICLLGLKYFPVTFHYILPPILTNGLYIARLAYFCIGSLGFLAIFGLPVFVYSSKRTTTFTPLVTQSIHLFLLAFHLLALLLHKQHNHFLFVLFLGEIYFLWQIFDNLQDDENLPLWAIIMIWRWTGFSAFFALGNSNSFATIDIGNAYTGLENYNEVVVASLTFLIGYSGPIYFYLALLISLVKHLNSRRPNVSTIKILFVWRLLLLGTITITFRACFVALFSVIIISLRYHLFIWTVFSPKYFYEIFHTLFDMLQLIITIGIAFATK
jgi:ethanolaminephosphotransferase